MDYSVRKKYMVILWSSRLKEEDREELVKMVNLYQSINQNYIK